MKNFSVHIKSQESANIFVQGNLLGLIDNIKNHRFDLKVYSDNLIITKEPLSENKNICLPYSVKVDFADTPTCNSTYAKIVPYKNNEYDIILLASETKRSETLEKIYDEYVQDLNIVVINDGKSFVNIYDNNQLKLSLTTPQLKEVFCQKHENILVLKAVANTDYYFIVVGLNNMNVLYNGFVQKYETTENTLKLLTPIYDIAKHGKVTLIYHNEASVSEYYVYLEDNNNIKIENEIIPYAFLQTLRIKNFDLAKKYLTNKLQEEIQDMHFESYFGNIEEIYYNTYNSNTYLPNYTIKTQNTYKSFDFTIVNNKIDEIEEVDF